MKTPAILTAKIVLTVFVDVGWLKHAKVIHLDPTATLQIVLANARIMWILVVLKKYAMEPSANVDPVNHVMGR